MAQLTKRSLDEIKEELKKPSRKLIKKQAWFSKDSQSEGAISKKQALSSNFRTGKTKSDRYDERQENIVKDTGKPRILCFLHGMLRDERMMRQLITILPQKVRQRQHIHNATTPNTHLDNYFINSTVPRRRQVNNQSVFPQIGGQT